MKKIFRVVLALLLLVTCSFTVMAEDDDSNRIKTYDVELGDDGYIDSGKGILHDWWTDNSDVAIAYEADSHQMFVHSTAAVIETHGLGTVTVTHKYYVLLRGWLTETYTVNVVERSVQEKEVKLFVSSNFTGDDSYQTYGTVKVNMAYFNGEETYDVRNRVLDWTVNDRVNSDGTVNKDTDLYNVLSTAFKTQATTAGFNPSNVTSVSLVPYKLVKLNADDYALYCKPLVKSLNVANVLFMVEDVNEKGYKQFGGGMFVQTMSTLSQKTTISTPSDLVLSKEVDSMTYKIDKVYTNDRSEGTAYKPDDIEIQSSTVLYASYVAQPRKVQVNCYWTGSDKLIESYTYETTDKSHTVVPNEIAMYTPVEASKTIETIPGETVEVNFEFYINVTLTANSKTVTYNGQEQSVSGYTSVVEFPNIEVGAKGTEIGEYVASFPEGTIGTVDESGRYIVNKTIDGKLTITSEFSSNNNDTSNNTSSSSSCPTNSRWSNKKQTCVYSVSNTNTK